MNYISYKIGKEVIARGKCCTNVINLDCYLSSQSLISTSGSHSSHPTPLAVGSLNSEHISESAVEHTMLTHILIFVIRFRCVDK